jgi:hypothetical protein
MKKEIEGRGKFLTLPAAFVVILSLFRKNDDKARMNDVILRRMRWR